MKNLEVRTQNALDAIPRCGSPPLSGYAIYAKQAVPRLPRADVYSLLADLAIRGVLVSTVRRGHTYFRLSDAIADSRNLPYTGRQRKEFSLDAADDAWFRYLLPLRLGKPVRMWMYLPQTAAKKTHSKPRQKLAIIQPGACAGLPPELILISILGSGSAVVHPFRDEGVASLVLAGMPARLAKALMNQLHRIFKR